MSRVTNNLYEFGAFSMDAQNRALRRAGATVPLTPKAFELLLVLVQSAGRIVTKDELMQAVWPDSFVEESNLTQTIFMVRKALDETSGRRYILTVQGQGYRFLVPVTEAAVSRPEMEAAEPPPTAVAELPEHPQTRRATGWRGPVLAFSVVAVVLVLIVAAIIWLWHTRHGIAEVPDKIMLAVLPFENFTGDPRQDYFSDGLTEEMITQLGCVDPSRLGVIARTSVMNYKGARKPLNEVGRELGVQYVLEGSVRRNGDKVRVTAQLIQLSDQTHLWAQEYDREVKDILVIQSDISAEIASEIERKLGAPQSHPAPSVAMTPERAEAYDLYLKGLYFFNKRTAFPEAIQNLQRAVARDPQYAVAYALLADTYTLMGAYQQLPASDYADQARASAIRAVELDDHSAEAHTALALIAQNHDYDWKKSEQEFRRAIALDPNYATAHQWYAEHLMWLGRFDEALAESERARQLDPLSLIIATDNAYLLYTSRQYDRAIKQYRSVLDRDPGFGKAHDIGLAYVQTGQCSAALDDWHTQQSEDFSWYWVGTAYREGRCGTAEPARKALDRVLELEQQQTHNPTGAAVAFLGVGDKERALDWLGRAYRERANELTKLKVDPIFDPLRNDPRFQDLLRRVGLDKS